MRAVILLVPLALVACGSSGGQAPAKIQLSSAGASPGVITVPSGGQVDFVNKDTADHQIASTDCSELASPKLTTGQDFLATLTTGPKTCTFKDGLNPSNNTFSGTVTVTAPGMGGGGGSGY
jgi:hypothetical protein